MVLFVCVWGEGGYSSNIKKGTKQVCKNIQLSSEIILPETGSFLYANFCTSLFVKVDRLVEVAQRLKDMVPKPSSDLY